MEQSIRWRGVRREALASLQQRDYRSSDIVERLSTSGLEGGQALASENVLREAGAWIPGVLIFHRTVHPQRQRGHFGELARAGEGPLGSIGLWPRQWATARMFAGSAKGFHIHPPYIPEGMDPETWNLKLATSSDSSIRPYDREQWDVMYIVQGRAEMFLIDERAGLRRTRMRFTLDGDEFRGPNTIGVVIPPGVAHALRCEGSSDVIMVYGTSTTFDPEAEGRIAAEIEADSLPVEWKSLFDT